MAVSSGGGGGITIRHYVSRRRWDFRFYELMTSDGSLSPDGTRIWTRHFGGEAAAAAATLDWLNIDFSPPLARSAVGEIHPLAVSPGTPTEFTYYLRPDQTQSAGFDRLAVEASAPLQFIGAVLDGATVDVQSDPTASGFRSSYKIKDVDLPNRFVMAPMARQKSPGGIDFLHASTRRFWLPEFDGSEVNTGIPPNSPDQDWIVLFKGQKMYDNKMGQ